MSVPSTKFVTTNAGTALDLSGYKVTFEDNFDTLNIATSTEKNLWYSAVHIDFGQATFKGENAFSTSNGILNIQMKQVDGQWQSGLLQTVDAQGNGFSQSYGYFEVRASFPAGAGSWPAFWLISDGVGSQTQPRVEFDTIEAYDLDASGMHTNIHYTPGTDTPDIKTKMTGGDYDRPTQSLFDGQFHTYGTMITDQWIITYFDGKEVSRVAANEYTRSPFYMILNLAMSKDGAVADPNSVYDMKVDYVRAYSNPELTAQWANLSGPSGTLKGDAGANKLAGTLGADVLIGGPGNDIYYVNHVDDKVIERAQEGTDSVFSSVNFSMAGQFIENLTLTGTANLNGTGNGLANQITGNSGNNIIDGGGGADIMIGGAGDDTYYVDNINDKIVEKKGEGYDTVYASVSYSLGEKTVTAATFDQGTQFIEKLVLTGTGNLSATGNAYTNTLVGNVGNNILDGGLGADTMIGGKGNDTYYVDNIGDKIVELAGEGTDTVYTSVDFKMEGLNVEIARMLGNGALSITGSSSADTIYGNSGNNVINGGAGADTMIGGEGNDTYYVDNIGDKVVEKAGEGDDLIYSTINYSLAGTNVERLTFLGSANLEGTGSSGADILTGNAGNNVLRGGAGADTLIGGLGNDILFGDSDGGIFEDRFVLNWTPKSPNVDTIMDFQHGVDKIALDNSGFKLFDEGVLADGVLQYGLSATSTGPHLLYSQSVGKLFYDADGNGAGQATLIAILANHAELTASDFIII